MNSNALINQFSLFLKILGIFCLIVGEYFYQIAEDSKNWKPFEATVLKSEVVTMRSGDSIRNYIRIEIISLQSKRHYVLDREDFGIAPSTASLEKIASKYTKDKIITAYFDPKKPQNIALSNSPDTSRLRNYQIFGFFSFILSILVRKKIMMACRLLKIEAYETN